MTVLRNNFDGGPDGTDITAVNSGQVPGNNPFDSVQNSASLTTTLQYKSADGLGRNTAEYVMRAKVTNPVGGGVAYVTWYTSMGAQSQFWLRFYCRFPVLPDNFLSPLIFRSADLGSGTYRAALGIFSEDGSHLLFTDDPGGTVDARSVTPVIEDAWWRVEARFQLSTTTGNGEVRYYEDADSDSDTPTDVFSFSGWNLGGATADFFIFGYTVPDQNLEDMYLSGLALSSEDWIGPAPFKQKGVPGVLSTPLAVHSDVW